ncbi:MAG: metallophosphoesterase family protein [Candidatus Nanoarchaeia archaeon]|nr:metallophosphoesterase family protein [Candidatus Nanoarchaeia archaeon]
MIELIKDFPAAIINDYLVISDLHIGFEKELQNKGYFIPSQSEIMLKSIISIKQGAEKIIILGDLKHEISPKYKKEITDFLAGLSKNFKEIIIIKGNHDGLIENYSKNFKNIIIKDELILDDYLFIHGHKMPSNEAIKKAKMLILGHFHANYEFKNYLGKITKLKTWNIYEFNNKKFYENKKIKTSITSLISFSAFNEFFMGSSEKNGPLKDYISLKESITINHLKVL